INQANQYIQKAQARKETLEEMNEDYTGFYHGVKEVLKAKNHTLEGIEGAVAELIQVPKQYAIAIETALGSAMQNIVVQTEEHVRQANSILKRRQLRRGTMFTFSVMKVKKLPTQQTSILNSQHSFAEIAVKLIDFKHHHSSAIHHIPGNIGIEKDLPG